MAQRLTPGQIRVRRRLASLARTAIDLCDVIDATGYPVAHVPRLWWLAMSRWGCGDGDPKRLGVDLATTGGAVTRWDARRDHGPEVMRLFALVYACFRDALDHWPRNPGHEWAGRTIAKSLALVYEALGDPYEVAAAKVRDALRRHGLDVEREYQEARLRQSAASRAADKERAEAILGTGEK